MANIVSMDRTVKFSPKMLSEISVTELVQAVLLLDLVVLGTGLPNSWALQLSNLGAGQARSKLK